MPSVVFRMLRDLEVEAGNRVLEIGTGTGWNAALLAHRLGAGNVVTLDVDKAVADRARTALNLFGLRVNVVHGDGRLGYPEGAPYDRVIATCGWRDFPWSWVEQTRPGGVIVLPWGTHYGNGDAVAQLVVADDGLSAWGQFTGPVEFMKARAQRAPVISHADYVRGGASEREKSSTSVTESDFLGADRFSPQRFAVAVRVPHCVHVVAEKRDGARPVWLYGLTDRSWACVMFQDGATAQVRQSGARRLWDEAEAAYRWWEEMDRPGHERFGLTVDVADEQRVWLDDVDANWPV